MTVYVAQAYVAFDGATNSDAWAQGQAQWVKDNLQVLTGQALLVPGTAGERSSYCVVSQVETDGTLTMISAYHVNDQGTLTQGLPGIGNPHLPAPEWNGTTNYVIGDRVTYLGIYYVCIQNASANPTWTPDVVPALWAVE